MIGLDGPLEPGERGTIDPIPDPCPNRPGEPGTAIVERGNREGTTLEPVLDPYAPEASSIELSVVEPFSR